MVDTPGRIPLSGRSSDPRSNSAIVEVFPDEPIVPQIVPRDADTRTPVKCRRIETYFKPVESANKNPDRNSTPSSGPADSPAAVSSRGSPCAATPSVKSEDSSDAVAGKKILYIPPLVGRQTTFNRSVSCPGCGKIFLCQIGIKNGQKSHCPHPDYYTHCHNCKAYLNLRLTRDCNACFSTFLDQTHYDEHLNFGGGRPGSGCRVNAERNFNKHHCKTTSLDVDNSRYFAVPEDAGLIKPKPAQAESVSAPPVAGNGPLAIGYPAACATPPPSSSDALVPFSRAREPAAAASVAVIEASTRAALQKDAEEGRLLLGALQIFVPQAPANGRAIVVPCDGCGKEFDGLDDGKTVYTRRDYYDHCIFLCRDYTYRKESEGPPKTCTKCFQIFLDASFYESHLPCRI